MAKLELQGRLGNNLIQFIAAFLFCKKHKLNLHFNDILYNYQYDTVPYYYNLRGLTDENLLSFVKNNEEICFDKKIIINDDNFLEYFYKEKIDSEITFNGYFYVFSIFENERENVKKLFKIKYEDTEHNDLFIHYRLGDVNDSNHILPLDYFIESIENVTYQKGYISSDSINDKKCQFLINKYNLIPINLNPYETIMFGKNFNNLILSESTFSFLIGYFSQAKNIIYNKNKSKWGNDFMFNFSDINL
jgi:hypothetical protein